MTYPIQRGACPPIHTRGERGTDPFLDLLVGHFFSVPVDPNSPLSRSGERTKQGVSWRNKCQYWKRVSRGERVFAVRTIDSQIRIYRIA